MCSNSGTDSELEKAFADLKELHASGLVISTDLFSRVGLTNLRNWRLNTRFPLSQRDVSSPPPEVF